MQAKQATTPNETLSQYVWTLLILGFFGVQAIVWLVALTLTANDRTQAIVAGYDEKGLKWDEQRAEQLASDTLGWTANIQIEDESVYGQLRRVTVHLADRENHAVAGADMELKLFHCGHAADTQAQRLTEREPGVYSATFKFDYAGNWDMSLVATREHERFLSQQRIDVPQTGGMR